MQKINILARTSTSLCLTLNLQLWPWPLSYGPGSSVRHNALSKSTFVPKSFEIFAKGSYGLNKQIPKFDLKFPSMQEKWVRVMFKVPSSLSCLHFDYLTSGRKTIIFNCVYIVLVFAPRPQILGVRDQSRGYWLHNSESLLLSIGVLYFWRTTNLTPTKCLKPQPARGHKFRIFGRGLNRENLGEIDRVAKLIDMILHDTYICKKSWVRVLVELKSFAST